MPLELETSPYLQQMETINYTDPRDIKNPAGKQCLMVVGNIPLFLNFKVAT